MAKKKTIKTDSKTMIAQVVIKRHSDKGWSKVPDFGMGKGVLSEQEIKFNDDYRRGFDSPMFSAALLEYEDQLLRDTVEVIWKEKK